MSAQPVDVLAVLDEVLDSLPHIAKTRTRRVAEARAAVAELIEACRDLCEEMDAPPVGPLSDANAAVSFLVANERFRAALARVSGEAA